MAREYAPLSEATGQWLEIGDVITHVNRFGSSCHVSVGVVTDVNKENRTIMWRRVEQTWRHGVKAYDWADRDTKIHRLDLCTKTGMTLERLKAKFNIPEREEEHARPETEPLGTRIPRPITEGLELAE